MRISSINMMAVLLITIALLERFYIDLGPNIELVTTASILTGLYLKPKIAWIVPLIIMLLSDLYLGIGLISIFTWSGFFLITVLPKMWKKHFHSNLTVGTVAGIMGSLIFYFWTNFGVWLTDRWGMYSNNITGLISSYINGLPFLKLNLLSTIIFVPTTILLVEFILHLKKHSINNQKILTN